MLNTMIIPEYSTSDQFFPDDLGHNDSSIVEFSLLGEIDVHLLGLEVERRLVVSRLAVVIRSRGDEFGLGFEGVLGVSDDLVYHVIF